MTDYERSSVVLAHERAGGDVEILLAGKLDLSSVGRLRDAVLQASHDTNGRVAVDTSRVTAVDGVGLRTLIACRRLAAALGAQMIIERPSRPVLARLSSTGLLRTFKVTGAPPAPDGSALTGPDRRAATAR